ncbi:MAG: 6,7-dimethyl-8-ribityllumazine synthase [Ignavibacteria bacterium]|nr:6,7-dimethyl-8-ribityllumazine synthase [Ignavibacteria bacterium]
MNRRTTRKTTDLSGRGFRIALIVSEFNSHITEKLRAGALQCLRDHKVRDHDVRTFVCPGAFEIPQVAAKITASQAWDAVICLGAVVRGETPHFEYVSSETARGIQDVALRSGIPLVFGVLTTNNNRQALARAGGKHGNKGWDAALTALKMIHLFKKIPRETPRRRR